jgi:hypothetical protein
VEVGRQLGGGGYDPPGLRHALGPSRIADQEYRHRSGPGVIWASALIRLLLRNPEKLLGPSFGSMAKKPRMGTPGEAEVPGIEPASSLAWSRPSGFRTPLNRAKIGVQG